MSKRKCKGCGERKSRDLETAVTVGVMFFCTNNCRIDYGIANAKKMAEKAKERREKKERKVVKEKKKKLMTRSQWFNKLQMLINQRIKIRDENEACCTCGTRNPHIKYDAGHFIPVGRGGVDPRRFEITNIHKQCSVQCNVHGSGMRAEYRDFIIGRYGKEHLDWLEGVHNHKPLKEQFPDWQSIEAEIIKQRKIIRELGEKPAC